ncbi:MAG TPA: hypothetical protein VGH87_21395 [Polyangiaceae bacterium]|nr:hypothetical protein [Polyangiaceae bacterium]
MRGVALAFALVACRTEAPVPNDVAVGGSAGGGTPQFGSASSSTPVIESPPPSASASGSASALPARAAAIPDAWLACGADTDCAAIKSACCGSWPSNVANRAHVRDAVTAADTARNFCRNRLCIQKVDVPACDHGKCVIR